MSDDVPTDKTDDAINSNTNSNSLTEAAGTDSPLYFAEIPLENESDDEFHHIEVVDVLETAILRSSGSVNIALYGGWGIGKSTIINFMNSRVKSKPEFNDYQHVLIDAWKLSPNVLRSELLEELALQLGIDKNNREKIYDQLHNISEVQDKIHLTRLDKIKKTLINLIPAYPVPAALIAYWIGQSRGIDLTTHAIWSIIAGPLILGVSELFLKISKKTEVTSRRFIQKAESSQKFKEIFDDILTAKQKNKLIITIDNLDRCDEKSAVKILSSVKTFMGNENCIYVIPCDESALLHHLQQEFNTFNDPQHAKEFLRKFFQIIIYVPPNIKSDLSGYVDSLMAHFPNIPFDSHVNEILISGGLSNPRKIRQYLYNLSIQYQLADLREKNPDDILSSKIITNNTGFLTKLIVIRDEWPTIFEKLHYLPTLLNSYHSYLNDPNKMYDNEIKEQIIDDFKKFPEFEKFMRATSLIVVDDIRPFLNLSQEPYETISEGFMQINSHASQNNLEELKHDLSTLSSEEEIHSSFKGLISLIKYHIDNNNSQYAFNVMNSLLELYDKIPQDLHELLLEKFSNYLSSTPEIRQSINQFDFNKIFPLIMKMNSYVKEQLLLELCSRLVDFRPANLNIVEQFTIHYNEIPESVKNKFDSEISQLGNSDEKEFLKVLEKLLETQAGQSLIRTRIPEALISRINNTPSDDNSKKIDLFYKITSKATEATKINFVKSLFASLNLSKISTLDENSQWVLNKLIEFSKHDSSLNDMLFNHVRKLIPKLENHAHKIIVLKSVFSLIHNIDSKLIDDFANNEFDIDTLITNPTQFLEIFNLSQEAKLSLVHNDTMFEKIVNRFSGLPLHGDVYSFMLQQTPLQKLPKLIQLIEKKIESFDPNQINIIISALLKSKTNFSSEQYDSVLEKIIQRLNKYGFDQNKTTFNNLWKLIDTFSPSVILTLSNVMLTWLSTNNPPQMNDAKTNLEKLLVKIPSEKQSKIFIQLMKLLSEKLNKNQIEMAKIIIPLIFENKDSFDKSLMEEFVNILCKQLVAEKPPVIQTFSLEYLSKLDIVIDQIHAAIISLRKSSPDGNIQNLCDKTCQTLGLLYLKKIEPFEVSGGKPEDGQISKNLVKTINVAPDENNNVYFEYEVPIKFGPKKNKNACSDVKLHIYHNENKIHTSDWLGYPGRPDEELPLSTGIIKLDGLPPGKCELQIMPEGREGGCNKGFIGNWNGTVYTYELPKSDSKK